MDLTVEEFDKRVEDKERIEGNNRHYRFEPFEECPHCGEYKYLLSEKLKGGSGFFSAEPTRTIRGACLNCRLNNIFAEDIPRHPDRN